MFAGGGIPYGLMRGMAGGGRRRGGADPWFLMLAYQLWQQIERLGPNKPKLTLGLMALCAAMHFEVLGALSPLALLGVHSAREACLSPRKVFRPTRSLVEHALGRLGSFSFSSFRGGEFRRLLASPFVFADDVHLAVNLSSFLLQGARLETRMGARGFARFLACVALAVQTAHVFAAELLRRWGVVDVTRACVTGASGVNFALKAYLSVLEPGYVSMWGFVIPGKFSAGAEILIIHLLNPHAPSLVYHAVGLIVGVAFATCARGETNLARRSGSVIAAAVRWIARLANVALFRGFARPGPAGRPDPPPGVRDAHAAAGGPPRRPLCQPPMRRRVRPASQRAPLGARKHVTKGERRERRRAARAHPPPERPPNRAAGGGAIGGVEHVRRQRGGLPSDRKLEGVDRRCEVAAAAEGERGAQRHREASPRD